MKISLSLETKLLKLTQEILKIKWIHNHRQHGKGVKELLALKQDAVFSNVEGTANAT